MKLPEHGFQSNIFTSLLVTLCSHRKLKFSLSRIKCQTYIISLKGLCLHQKQKNLDKANCIDQPRTPKFQDKHKSTSINAKLQHKRVQNLRHIYCHQQSSRSKFFSTKAKSKQNFTYLSV